MLEFLFKIKFCTESNSNMLNSVLMLNFLIWKENTHFGQIWSKNLNCLFKGKFGT